MKYLFPIVTWGILIVFLLYQVIVPSSIASAKGDYSSGAIAEINVGGKKQSEIETLLASEVEKWKENDIIVQGSTARIVVPSNYIHFDIKKTVKHYMTTSSKPWYNLFSGDKNIQLPLEVSVDERIHELLNEAPLFFVDETINEIVNYAGLLKQGPLKAQEVALSKDLLSRIAFETQEVTVNVNGLSQIIDVINETTLLNGESFSFLGKLTDADSFYNDATANFIASTLYSAVLKSEMDIQERHSQNSIPNYLAAGIEVKVDAKRNQDFAFINNTNRPVSIYAFIQDDRLVIELYSFESKNVVSYTSNTEIVKPRTIYRLTSTLPAGEERVLEEGKDGQRVQVNKKISSGATEKEEVVSRDFYPPQDTVILVSSLEPPVSLVAPGEIITNPPTSPQDNITPKLGDQTTPNKEDSIIGNGDIILDENGDPIPKGGTYDKGGNLITSDPQ